MFLREALRRGAELEEEASRIYTELAGLHHRQPKLAAMWSDLAADEMFHARVLIALGAAQEVLEDDGPFLVHVPLQLARLQKTVDAVYQRVCEGVTPEQAVDLADQVESAEMDEVFECLVDVARTGLDRLVRLLDREASLLDMHREKIPKLRQLIAASRSAA